MGLISPTGRAILGTVFKHWESAAVYAANEIIQSLITAWQRYCCNRLQCSQHWLGQVTLSPHEKSALPPAMWPFVKILRPLVTVIIIWKLTQTSAIRFSSELFGFGLYFFLMFFVSGPCARLSWPSRQLLSTRQSTVSYHIVWHLPQESVCERKRDEIRRVSFAGVSNSLRSSHMKLSTDHC